MFKLDLSKFKKVASDKESTTMQHEDGHRLVLDHSKLSPKIRGQLKSLPGHEEQKHVPRGTEQKMAKGGEVKKMKDGGEIDLADLEKNDSVLPPKEKPLEEELDALASKEQPDSPPSEPMQIDPAAATAPPPGQAPIMPGQQQPAPGMPAAPGAQEQGALTPTSGELPDAQTPTTPDQVMGEMPGLEEGYKNTIQGVAGETQAQSDVAKQQAKIQRDATVNAETAKAKYDTNVAEAKGHIADLTKAISEQKINPDAYWENHSKVAAAIGMFLGGFSTKEGPNQVTEYINKQIERSVDAQKTELGKKQNLLSFWQSQLHNEKDAAEMTKISMQEITAHQMEQTALKMQDPILRAQALQKVAAYQQSTAPQLQQLMMRRTLAQTGPGGLSGTDPAKLIPFIVPKEHQAQAFAELKEYEELGKAKKNALNAFDQIAKINTVGNRAMNPIQSKSQMAALQGPIVAELSKATAGRFTEQDAKYLESQWPSVTDTGTTLAVKKEAIDKLISEKLNATTLDGWSLSPEKFAKTSTSETSRLAPQQQAALNWAKANPTNPAASKVMAKFKAMGIE